MGLLPRGRRGGGGGVWGISRILWYRCDRVCAGSFGLCVGRCSHHLGSKIVEQHSNRGFNISIKDYCLVNGDFTLNFHLRKPNAIGLGLNLANIPVSL